MTGKPGQGEYLPPRLFYVRKMAVLTRYAGKLCSLPVYLLY